MEKKKTNWFIKLLTILFIIFMGLFIASESGYYEAKLSEKVVLTDNLLLEDLLVNGNICSSKREARELIKGNAISLNNTKITEPTYLVTKANAIDNKVYLIKKGKKKYYLGIFE